MSCSSVHPVSTSSSQSVPAVERSTTSTEPRDSDGHRDRPMNPFGTACPDSRFVERERR
jgi:hypothetical protein